MSFPFSRVHSSGVWSGLVWMSGWSSGSAAGLAALGELGISVMPALTFLFALPPCKVSLPFCAMPELPESLIHFLGFGLFHTKTFWVWSFPDQTYVTSGHNLCHSCRLSLGWPGGDLSSVSLVSAVKRGEWSIASALWSLDHSKGILGQRDARLGLPFLWDTEARDMALCHHGTEATEARQGLCSKTDDV